MRGGGCKRLRFNPPNQSCGLVNNTIIPSTKSPKNQIANSIPAPIVPPISVPARSASLDATLAVSATLPVILNQAHTINTLNKMNPT